MRLRRRVIIRVAVAAVLAMVAIVAIMFGTRGFWNSQSVVNASSDPECLRSELELRDGRLYELGNSEAFNGKLVEGYSPDRRKLEIEIREGLAHGLSRGWFANGQMEVEETFLKGVSNGPRTRWHQNGERKSLAHIENGHVMGEYLEWYENGQLATQMTVEQGQPAGLVESWHPSGVLKSRGRFENGKQVDQQFFDDSAAPPNDQRAEEGSGCRDPANGE